MTTPMPSDSELLRQFGESHDEAAFAEVVRRHADLVYSVALRMTRSDAIAQDVTQTVFTKLARQAVSLSCYDTVVGWLHHVARNSAIDAIRGEERRRAREQESFLMQNNAAAVEVNWESIGPLLDEAVGQLHEDDRKAVLLRYFKNLSHQEVGSALGLSEDTARKRIERAVEKLRDYFTSRGVTASSALLATAISAKSVQAAPVGLAKKVAPVSLAAAGGAGLGGAFPFSLIMSTKTKIIIALVVILLIASAILLRLQNQNEPQSRVFSVAAFMPKTIAANGMAHASPQVDAPVIAPVMPSATPAPVAAQPASAPAKPSTTPPELQNTIAEIIAVLKSGDLVALYENFMPPEELAAMTQKQKTFMENDARRTTRNSKQDTDPMIDMMGALNGLSPTFNETGDTATFEVPLPESARVALARQGFKLAEIPPTLPETFVKRNGKWYLTNIAYPIETP